MIPGTAPPYYEYTVRPTDTLSQLIFTFYDFVPASPNYQSAKDYLLSLNPEIKNPDRIQVGQILRVAEYPPPSIFTGPNRPPHLLQSLQDPPLRDVLGSQTFITSPVHPLDRDTFWALSWLEHHDRWLTVPGGVAFEATSNLMSPSNRNLIEKVADLYADYTKNKITKGQYDAQRQLLLNQFKHNVGPIEHLLFGNHTTHQAIRIAKAGGIPATARIAQHAGRLKMLATVSKVGGVVLTGVGVTAACMQIAHTQDKTKKNEIVVETLVSTTIGTVGGLLVGLYLVSNPIGWGTALILAVGSAAVSSYAGTRFATAYTAWGTPFDLVSGNGVGMVCR